MAEARRGRTARRDRPGRDGQTEAETTDKDGQHQERWREMTDTDPDRWQQQSRATETISGRQQLRETGRKRETGKKMREGGKGGHEPGGQGEPMQQEPELKSRQPRARDPQPHPERVRDLKPPGDGTRETDKGQREIQRGKPDHSKSRHCWRQVRAGIEKLGERMTVTSCIRTQGTGATPEAHVTDLNLSQPAAMETAHCDTRHSSATPLELAHLTLENRTSQP